MQTELSRSAIEARYQQAAEDYLRSLPLEHFMEATPQATQRMISIESLRQVQARRPDIQLFNELLVQYPLPAANRPGQVVPDNMIVLYPEPIVAGGSYDMPLQPVGPFWVLEYVSPSSRRKDYNDNVRRYEQDLKVPYYLHYLPEEEDLTLYRMVDERYVSVQPNENDRLAIPELDMEVAVKDGWVRFWFRGELVPLSADLVETLDETRLRLAESERQLVRQRAEADQKLAELERQRAESERQRVESERQRAEILEQARLDRLAAEEEIARLRALLAQRTAPSEGS